MECRFDQIEQMFNDFLVMQQSQIDIGNISLATEISQLAVKNLILASCSVAEPFLQSVVEQAVSIRCEKNPLIMHLITKKLIDRQYHSWFDWEAKNVNKFLKIFGDDFFHICSKKILDDHEINDCAKNFLRIGYERNIIIHANMFSYRVQNTPDELMKNLRKKKTFLDWMSVQLLSPT